MQRQAESPQPLFQVGQEAFGLVPVLEAEYEVIGVTNDDHIASGVPARHCRTQRSKT